MIGMFRSTLRIVRDSTLRGAPACELEDRVPPSIVCKLKDRAPLSILCYVFAFLDGDAHAALSQTNRYFEHAAQLPGASCHDVTLDWRAMRLSVSPATLASRPRVVRVFAAPPALFVALLIASVENWLALVPQLHTLQLYASLHQSLCGLSKIGSLRHLLLGAPSTYTLASALRGCGSRLRSLHLRDADDIDVLMSVAFEVSATTVAKSAPGTRRAAASRIEKTSVAAQLGVCAALESLGLHAKRRFCNSDVVAFVHAARLPALRSLSIIQQSCAAGSLGGLASHTALTCLGYHSLGPFTVVIDRVWPQLPCLRTLDLGASMGAHDYVAIQRAFPSIARLRVACDHPAQLASFAGLTDLTVLHTYSCNTHDGGSPQFQDQIATLLSLLPSLRRFGLMGHRDIKSTSALPWVLPGATHLALGLRPDCCPTVNAPALRSLRANNMPAETLLRIAADCPLLERVELCGSPTRRKEVVKTARARLRGVAVVDCDAEFDLSGEFCGKTFAAADDWP